MFHLCKTICIFFFSDENAQLLLSNQSSCKGIVEDMAQQPQLEFTLPIDHTIEAMLFVDVRLFHCGADSTCKMNHAVFRHYIRVAADRFLPTEGTVFLRHHVA